MIKTENKILITDMDGTLYRLNSKNNQYSGSSLESAVLSNAKSFILGRKFCTEDQVDNVIAAGLSDSIGLSSYIQKTYGSTRNEYFDEVWNINPDGMLTDYEDAVATIRELSAKNILILLTSSGKVWQEQVCEYLEITDLFSKKYTAEDFSSKDEIFARLSRLYDPTQIISIGDQFKTDIEPAAKYGIQTLWVKEPKDIIRLIKE